MHPALNSTEGEREQWCLHIKSVLSAVYIHAMVTKVSSWLLFSHISRPQDPFKQLSVQVVKATASTPLNTLVCRQASSTLPLEETLMKPFMILSAANPLLFRARIIFPMHVEGEHFVCRAVGGSKVGLLLRVCSLPFPYHQCPVNNVHPLLYSHNMCMCICAFVCLPKSC